MVRSFVPRPDDAADALALAICQVQSGAVSERLEDAHREMEEAYREKGSSRRKSGK